MGGGYPGERPQLGGGGVESKIKIKRIKQTSPHFVAGRPGDTK